MMMGCPVMPLTRTSPLAGGVEVEGVEVTEVVVTPMICAPPEGGEGRRMDFLVRSKSPNLVARKDILMTWPMPLGRGPTVSLITVIIEDSYLMPLVVSSLKGDALDVFDWTQSITLGGTQDLSMLLQMLCEH